MVSIVFIQFGNYLEAFTNFELGVPEKYYAQKHSVEYVSKLTQIFNQVTVVCLSSEYEYQLLANGVGVIGLDINNLKSSNLTDTIKSFSPSHIVCRTPNIAVLRYALKNEIKLLPILADSFPKSNLKQWVKRRFLASILNDPKIKFVGNHSINASKSLVEIGVDVKKVIPWDWPHHITPEMFNPKQRCSNDPQLFYAGQISKLKGVYDLVDAVAMLNKITPVKLKIAGNDKEQKLAEYIRIRKLEESIELLGLVPQNSVVNYMVEADMVVIPSRHEYPEGLPMTFYEGLLSRTPVIISNHKMLINKIDNRKSGLIFEASNPDSLAKVCLQLISDPILYSTISYNSSKAWHALKIKVEWSELVDHFIEEDLTKNDIGKISIQSY